MTSPAPGHEHEYHALWLHLGPLGRQDIHYHPCTEAEPGDCHAVLVGYGVDCDGKRATHAACELPVPDDLVIPGEPKKEAPPAPGPVGAPREDRVWLLRTPSHDRLVLAAWQPVAPLGNYSVTDITEAVREFIALWPEWVRDAQGAGQ